MIHSNEIPGLVIINVVFNITCIDITHKHVVHKEPVNCNSQVCLKKFGLVYVAKLVLKRWLYDF